MSLKREKTPSGTWRYFDDQNPKRTLYDGLDVSAGHDVAVKKFNQDEKDRQWERIFERQIKSAERWWRRTPAGKLLSRYFRRVSKLNKEIEEKGRAKCLEEEQRDLERSQRNVEAMPGAPVALYLGGTRYSAKDGEAISTPCEQPPSPQEQRKGVLAYLKRKRNQRQLPAATAGNIAKGTARRARILDRNAQLITEGMKHAERVKKIAKEENVTCSYVSRIIPKI